MMVEPRALSLMWELAVNHTVPWLPGLKPRGDKDLDPSLQCWALCLELDKEMLMPHINALESSSGVLCS